MRIAEITSIVRDESHIYYINRYKATAVVEFLSKQVSFPFNFFIEMNPLGGKTINVESLPRDLDYPLLPIIKALKDYICTLEKGNKLP